MKHCSKYTFIQCSNCKNKNSGTNETWQKNSLSLAIAVHNLTEFQT